LHITLYIYFILFRVMKNATLNLKYRVVLGACLK